MVQKLPWRQASLTPSAAFADFSVYQGRSGKLLGTFDTGKEARNLCNSILEGKSIINIKTGEEVNPPEGKPREAGGGGDDDDPTPARIDV